MDDVNLDEVKALLGQLVQAQEPTEEEEGRIERHDDGSVTLTLMYPVTITMKPVGGIERTEEISTLTFRRINGGDLIEAQKVKDEFEQSVTMFTRLSGITRVVYGKLDATDIETGAKIIAGFRRRRASR